MGHEHLPHVRRAVKRDAICVDLRSERKRQQDIAGRGAHVQNIHSHSSASPIDYVILFPPRLHQVGAPHAVPLHRSHDDWDGPHKHGTRAGRPRTSRLHEFVKS